MPFHTFFFGYILHIHQSNIAPERVDRCKDMRTSEFNSPRGRRNRLESFFRHKAFPMGWL